VVGFGRTVAKLYGLGEEFDMENELLAENQRFEENVSDELLPAVIRSKKGHKPKQWIVAPTADPSKLAAKAKKVNRTQLNYAGMSEGGGY
jgi:hypothetical protein